MTGTDSRPQTPDSGPHSQELRTQNPELTTRTFRLETFGCKVNQYESQALREALLARGCTESDPDAASFYIVNTCTVTEAARQEADRIARRLRRRNPQARIIITGCAAETDAAQFSTFAEVIGQRDKHRLVELLLSRDWKPETGNSKLFPLHKQRNEGIYSLSISRFSNHARAFMKVEDGCDLNCSFCIIPRVRGTVASRPLQAALDEARRLTDNGHREIVLTGVHLGSYGKDLAKRSLLTDLVERLLALPGLGRVRLSSIEVNEIDDALLDLMAAEPRRFCPHLHLPLQSGDDDVLRAMRRRYNTAQFLAACDRVRERVPDPAFTTDVIPGFPGETEAQFQNTTDFCRRIGFSRIHVFPYSPRRGTDAARLPDDVPGREKKMRRQALLTLAAELTSRYASRFMNRTVNVLVEDPDGSGYTERYLRARVPESSRGALLSGIACGLRLEACGPVLEVRP